MPTKEHLAFELDKKEDQLKAIVTTIASYVIRVDELQKKRNRLSYEIQKLYALIGRATQGKPSNGQEAEADARGGQRQDKTCSCNGNRCNCFDVT